MGGFTRPAPGRPSLRGGSGVVGLRLRTVASLRPRTRHRTSYERALRLALLGSQPPRTSRRRGINHLVFPRPIASTTTAVPLHLSSPSMVGGYVAQAQRLLLHTPFGTFDPV